MKEMTKTMSELSTDELIAQLEARQATGARELAAMRAERDALNAKIKAAAADQDKLDRMINGMKPRTRKLKEIVVDGVSSEKVDPPAASPSSEGSAEPGLPPGVI